MRRTRSTIKNKNGTDTGATSDLPQDPTQNDHLFFDNDEGKTIIPRTTKEKKNNFADIPQENTSFDNIIEDSNRKSSQEEKIGQKRTKTSKNDNDKVRNMDIKSSIRHARVRNTEKERDIESSIQEHLIDLTTPEKTIE